MPTKPRDTVVYELRDKNEIVYIGTANDTERRKQEHITCGKKFTSMNIISIKMTYEGAKKKEAERLEVYRRNHGGKNPKYNKDSNG